MLKLRKNGVDKMKSLLDEVQSYLQDCENGSELEDYQKPLIPTTQTFIQFGAEVDNGITPISGLIKYCHNAINVVKSGVENNAVNVPIVIHIGEKMAQTTLGIRNVVSADSLSSAEQQQLADCESAAKSWLENKERKGLLVDVDKRVKVVKTNLSEGGVLHVLKHRNEVLGPLLSWA